MATHVQVVLREDVKHLGSTGDLVRVRPGFARNYLVPRGLAALATAGNIQQIEHEKKAALARAAAVRKDAESLAQKISGLAVHVTKQAGEDGRLYGSVTTKDIAEALASFGVQLDKKALHVADAIKALGEHEITAKLSASVTTTFKVTVVAKS